MDRTGADFFAAVQSMVDRLGAHPVPVQLPIGQEEHFRGVDRPRRDEGDRLRRTTSAPSSTSSEIPAELAEQADEYHHQLIDAVADHDDELTETYLEDEDDGHARDAAPRAPRRRRSTSRSRRSCSAPPSRTRACSRCSTRSIDYLPSPLDVPPVHGVDPRTEHELSRRAGARRAVRGARVQGHVRPVRRQAHVLPRLLGPDQGRATASLNTTTGKTERIGRILQMHANHREEREEIGAGEIAAVVGLKATTTGDTLADRHGADRARVDDLPGAGDLGRDRAEDEGRPGQARRRRCSAWPRRIRPSACAPTRRPGRRSSPGWASCTSRSSSTA